MKTILLALCTTVAGLTAVLPLSATVLFKRVPSQGPHGTDQLFRIVWDDALDESPKQILLWDGDRGVLRSISDILPANVKEFLWNASADVQDGTRYRFVVRNSINNRQVEFSDGFFSIAQVQPLVSGVDNPLQNSDVTVTPFPANETIMVQWTEERNVKAIELLNIHYEVLSAIAVEQGSSTVTMGTKQLPSGMAMVRVISPDGWTVVRPLLIVH